VGNRWGQRLRVHLGKLSWGCSGLKRRACGGPASSAAAVIDGGIRDPVEEGQCSGSPRLRHDMPFRSVRDERGAAPWPERNLWNHSDRLRRAKRFLGTHSGRQVVPSLLCFASPWPRSRPRRQFPSRSRSRLRGRRHPHQRRTRTPAPPGRRVPLTGDGFPPGCGRASATIAKPGGVICGLRIASRAGAPQVVSEWNVLGGWWDRAHDALVESAIGAFAAALAGFRAAGVGVTGIRPDGRCPADVPRIS